MRLEEYFQNKYFTKVDLSQECVLYAKEWLAAQDKPITDSNLATLFSVNAEVVRNILATPKELSRFSFENFAEETQMTVSELMQLLLKRLHTKNKQ